MRPAPDNGTSAGGAPANPRPWVCRDPLVDQGLGQVERGGKQEKRSGPPRHPRVSPDPRGGLASSLAMTGLGEDLSNVSNRVNRVESGELKPRVCDRYGENGWAGLLRVR